MPIRVDVKLLNGGKMPEKKTEGAACFDCYSNEEIEIPAGCMDSVALGFCIAIPHGYEAVIRPRSGLAFKDRVYTIEGTIDSDYRGEVRALIKNDGTKPEFKIKRGDRVCQMKIQRSDSFMLMPVDELDETERGTNGFGSTGV